MLRGTAGAIVIATLIAGGFIGASAIRARGEAAAAARSASPTSDSSIAHDSRDPSASEVVANQAVAPAPSAPVVEAAPKAVVPPFEPAVPHGESPLSEGVIAVRSDSDVVVAFDTPMTRTRRPEKFEQIVRTTLTAVYGAPVQAVLARMPSGSIASQGELLTELPSRGVRIPVDDTWILHVFPETRRGQDGPLVIRYRVRVTPNGG